MPKVKRKGSSTPPEGYDLIEPELNEIHAKMRASEQESHEGKRKAQSLWAVMQVERERSRLVFDKYYKEKVISKELYQWLCSEGHCSEALINKWRKPGYDQLCCLLCAQSAIHAQKTSCVCRVPKADRKAGHGNVKCAHCGCTGCASGD